MEFGKGRQRQRSVRLWSSTLLVSNTLAPLVRCSSNIVNCDEKFVDLWPALLVPRVRENRRRVNWIMARRQRR